MPPDLNSLPPSRSMSSSPMQPRTIPPRHDGTPSPRNSPVTLATTAALNAADISRRSSLNNSRGSPRLNLANERRRSNVALNLNLNINDPSLPGPGELSSSDRRSSITQAHAFTSASPSSIGGNRVIADGDPHHHHRTPSLGEIHQELENEQEAQVNRLLQMIREQQAHLDQTRMLQESSTPRHSSRSASTAAAAAAAANLSATAAILDDLTPASERSFHLPTAATTTTTTAQPQTPHSHSRPSHRSSSLSPALRPRDSPHDHPPSPSLSHRDSLLEAATVRRNSNSLRDETAYYQAETASLTRENQMLRMRIRELERQVGDMGAGAGGSESRHASQPNAPSVQSPLVEGQDKS